jgi:hypothetical protein
MKTTTFARSMVYATLVASLAFPACGSSSGASCGKIEPCGGTLLGTWNASGACVNSMALMTAYAPAFAGFCPTTTVTSPKLTVSGSLTFNADMTYSVMLMEDVTFSINVPMSCLSGGTCAALSTALQGMTLDPSIQSITCAGTTTCACNTVLTPTNANETGTYSTSGTAAMLINSAGTNDGGDYCVQGNQLHLLTVDRMMNMGPMGQATINEDIVATKK